MDASIGLRLQSECKKEVPFEFSMTKFYLKNSNNLETNAELGCSYYSLEKRVVKRCTKKFV